MALPIQDESPFPLFFPDLPTSLKVGRKMQQLKKSITSHVLERPNEQIRKEEDASPMDAYKPY